MREFFKGHTIVGVALFLLAFIFGLTLRLANLSNVSAWGDELATLYYVRHFDFIFPYESHTPLYYFICKLWAQLFPASVYSFRLLFVSLSLVLALVMAVLAQRRRGAEWALVFFILWWCWPTEVTYSRHARHYGLVLELTMLLLLVWDSRGTILRWPKWSSLAFYQFLHPFLILPVTLLSLIDLGRKKIGLRQFLVEVSSATPVLLYYLAKYLSFGAQKVESNISWVSTDRTNFLASTLNLFAGEVQPFFAIFNLSPTKSFIFLLLVFFVLFFRWPLSLKRLGSLEGFVCLCALIITYIATEFISAYITNVRVPRYFIFLVPFIIMFFLSLFDPMEKPSSARPAVLLLCLMSFHVFVLRPWRSVTWDDQNVAAFKVIPKNDQHAIVVCGNPFQLEYYFQVPTYVCKDRALKLMEERKPFYLFDLNGNDKGLVLYLLEHMEVLEIQNMSHSTFLHVSPKEGTP